MKFTNNYDIKRIINRLNEFNIDKYGDCQVCRPHGLWDGTYINSVDITSMVNEHGELTQR